jgi:hypothetical protein
MMKRNAIAMGAVVMFGMVCQASAQSVNAGLALSAPAAVPSTCSVQIIKGATINVSSDGTHNGGVTVTTPEPFTFDINLTKGDLTGSETLKVVYEVNNAFVAQALSTYIDGVTARDFLMTAPPAYPGTSVAGVRNATQTQMSWSVPVSSVQTTRVQIGNSLNVGGLRSNAKLKFLNQSSVDVAINNAFSVSCQIEHAAGGT